jgi:hypothetical protein
MTDHPCLEYPAPAAAATPVPVMGAWVELVCGYAGLLRVEFDAIIAANFPGGAGQRHRRPPLRRGYLLTDRPRYRTPAAPTAGIGQPDRAHVDTEELRERARQRSPPKSPPSSTHHAQAPHALPVCGA